MRSGVREHAPVSEPETQDNHHEHSGEDMVSESPTQG